MAIQEAHFCTVSTFNNETGQKDGQIDLYYTYDDALLLRIEPDEGPGIPIYEALSLRTTNTSARSYDIDTEGLKAGQSDKVPASYVVPPGEETFDLPPPFRFEMPLEVTILFTPR